MLMRQKGASPVNVDCAVRRLLVGSGTIRNMKCIRARCTIECISRGQWNLQTSTHSQSSPQFLTLEMCWGCTATNI